MSHFSLSRDHKLYYFDPDVEPVIWVNSGDEITFYTTDAGDGQIKKETSLSVELDVNRANPVTGPVGILDTKPGDTLCTLVEDIKVAEIGYMMIDGQSFFFEDFLTESEIKLFTICNDLVRFGKDRNLVLKPMIGVIGTTPPIKVKTNLAGSHGGNMDNRFITTGSRVYLPVFMEGSLLNIGDLHAAMGDGEIAGCGIEVAGEVTVKLDIIHNWCINFPIIEDSGKFMVSGEGQSLSEAMKKACTRALELLTNTCKMSESEACFFIGAYAHVELCQSAFLKQLPQAVVRISIPKDVGININIG